MIVLLTAGCACPSFADMVVTDTEELADSSFEAEIAESIADFAAWTGREGVCVPEVEIVEDVDPEVETRFGGLYQGSRHPILIRAGVAGADRIVAHELCHALDRLEGHSAANPDVFSAEDVAQSDGYPTDEARSSESFADACDAGPDGSISARLDIQCGTEVADARFRYLHEFVFTAWESSADPVPLQVSEHAITMVDPVLAVGTSDDMLLVLTTDLYTVNVTEVDPERGEVGRSMVVADWTEDVVRVRVEADLVLLTHVTDGLRSTELLAFDLGTGAVRQVGTAGDLLPLLSTHADGIVYAAGGSLDGELVLSAWEVTTGVELPIAAPSAWGTLIPADGGVLALDVSGNLARYDRSTDTWSQQTIPSGWAGWRHGENSLLYLLSRDEASTPVLYDLDEETWRIVDPPCQDIGTGWSSFQFSVGERHILVHEIDGSNTLRYVEMAG